MSAAKKDCEGGRVRPETEGGGKLRLIFEGRFDSQSTGRLWPEVAQLLSQSKPKHLTVDAKRVDYCDGAAIALLLWLRRQQEKNKGEFAIEGLREEFVRLMEMLEPQAVEHARKKLGFVRGIVEGLGGVAVNLCRDLYAQITFTGEITAALCRVMIRPRTMRWKDAFIVAESAGANAFGIVSLIGFLFGLILAFQAAIPMREFGAEIFVADLVSLSLFRVMGPLLTAIILAARSGSAFAAELGTMKVNEEIDALTTMGLNPVRFLAVTRVTAAMVVTPLLAVFANLFGLLGAGGVMVSLGFAPVTYFNQVVAAVDVGDFFGGLVKAVVFGLLVGSIGCLRGLQTGAGSRAVGTSATRAVVSGIVLIVIAEGVFAVLFYFLGI